MTQNLSKQKELYQQARARVFDLAKSLTDDQLETQNKACPGWTVRDTIYHQAGLAKDVVDGNIQGSPEWSQKQIDDRNGMSVEDVLQEWEKTAETLEPMLENPKLFFATADLGSHELDIKKTLGLPIDKQDPIIE